MTVFARAHPKIGKRQTKLFLTETAYQRLKAVSDASGIAMSIIVEVLIMDHCRMDDDRPHSERRGIGRHE